MQILYRHHCIEVTWELQRLGTSPGGNVLCAGIGVLRPIHSSMKSQQALNTAEEIVSRFNQADPVLLRLLLVRSQRTNEKLSDMIRSAGDGGLAGFHYCSCSLVSCNVRHVSPLFGFFGILPNITFSAAADLQQLEYNLLQGMAWSCDLSLHALFKYDEQVSGKVIIQSRNVNVQKGNPWHRGYTGEGRQP